MLRGLLNAGWLNQHPAMTVERISDDQQRHSDYYHIKDYSGCFGLSSLAYPQSDCMNPLSEKPTFVQAILL